MALRGERGSVSKAFYVMRREADHINKAYGASLVFFVIQTVAAFFVLDGENGTLRPDPLARKGNSRAHEAPCTSPRNGMQPRPDVCIVPQRWHPHRRHGKVSRVGTRGRWWELCRMGFATDTHCSRVQVVTGTMFQRMRKRLFITEVVPCVTHQPRRMRMKRAANAKQSHAQTFATSGRLGASMMKAKTNMISSRRT